MALKKNIKNLLINAFPAPRYMTMPAIALDISPNSVKYLDAKYMAKGCLPGRFKEVFLPEGTIIDGVVKDSEALTNALKELKEDNYKFAFVAIPENALYLYTLHLKGKLNNTAIMQQIEFSFNEHVPIHLNEAIYDFDKIGNTRDGTVVSVTVAPKVVIEGYKQALDKAGFIIKSIELEACAVTRAISLRQSCCGKSQGGVEMIVDIGHSRAGIIMVKNSLPIFSITLAGGSQKIDKVLKECKKQYTFWDTRTNNKGKRIERIEKVSITGGKSKDFVKSLSDALGAEVQIANVWQNLFDINEHIPTIDATESQAMATLAGLLLKNKE